MNVLLAAIALASPSTPPIGIIGTFPAEASLLIESLQQPERVELGGLDVHRGRIHGREVVVMVCGVGSTNAGAGAALMIEKFRPSAVILNGVAGGTAGAGPNTIVLGSRVVAYGFGFQGADGKYAPWPTYQPSFTVRNPLFFSSHPRLVAAGRRAARLAGLQAVSYKGKTYAPSVVTGTIASSDVFTVYPKAIAEQNAQTGAVALEEEGASIAQICFQRQIPFLIVRAISNEAGPNGFEVFEALSGPTAANAQRLTAAIVREIP